MLFGSPEWVCPSISANLVTHGERHSFGETQQQIPKCNSWVNYALFEKSTLMSAHVFYT